MTDWFKKKNSCKKGKFCRFSHQITDGHRQDHSFQKSMEEKHQHIVNSKVSNGDHYNRRNSRLGADAVHTGLHQASGGHPSMHKHNGYPVKGRSTAEYYDPHLSGDGHQQFVHCAPSVVVPEKFYDKPLPQSAETGPLSFTHYPPRDPAPSLFQQQQQLSSTQGYPQDSPATTQPANSLHQMQTINLLQNLLSHMMMVSKVSGQEIQQQQFMCP